MKKSTRPSDLTTKIMRSVKSKDTGVEIKVRTIIRSLGYCHYRLHVKALPGSPDIVFRKYRKAIFVNGCFWHGHNCNKGRLPKSNVAFWKNKVDKNIHRDNRVITEFARMGWTTLTIWQCQLKDMDSLEQQLKKFLRQ